MTHLARRINSNLNVFEPWDIFFKDFFNSDTLFAPLLSSKPNYPVDIYENDDSIVIDIAAVGLDKEDVLIEEDNGILSVTYDKQKTEEQEDNKNNIQYYQKGITNKSFCLSWKFSERYDLKKIDASMEKGMLKIRIPKMEVQIKNKKVIAIK